MGKIIIYLEAKDNELKKVSRELATAAGQLGDEVIGVMSTQASEAIAAAGELGLNRLVNLVPEDGKLYAAQAYAAELRKLAEAEKPDYILFGQTPLGRDLAARVAAAMKLAFVNDVTAIEDKDDAKLFTKPLYAGKVISQFRFLAEPPCVVTIRPNIFAPAEAQDTSVGAETVSPDFSVAKSIITSLEMRETGMIDLKEADIIISGGRPLGSAENFRILKECASVLGAAVGASRAAVDAGFAAHAMQVGQTGKTVSPRLYIACGISGSVQHFAGMKTAKVVVAVNNDPDAPIFQKCDYGLRGDLFEVVPALTRALGSAQAK